MGTQIVERDSVGSLFGDRLKDAVLGMNEGRTRAGCHAWYFNDLARGRKINPLGVYPGAAAECVKKGRKFSTVARPLYETLAMLRALKSPAAISLGEALVTANKEKLEASIAELRLSLCIHQPTRAELEAAIREGREAIEAETVAVEAAEDALYKMEAK